MDEDIQNSVRAIMATQLTEMEVLVYLLMEEGGYSDYKIAQLPFGVSRSTARLLYHSAKEKMDRFADAGIFVSEVKHGK